MIKKIYVFSLILVSFILVGASCSLQTPASTPTNTATEKSVDSKTSQAITNSVLISGFAFTPAILTVKVGDTVTWTNNDSAPHIIKSSLFQSPTLSQGELFQYTFTQTGTVEYFCSIHPSMKAQIIVQ